MKLKSGRNNLAVTLFVPWDCGNNCPFCTTKQEYKDPSNFSLNKQINTLYQIWGIDDAKDIVITGGEPLADLAGLTELLSAICSMSMLKPKNVYINTSMHDFRKSASAGSFLYFFTLFKGVIKGVNVSEHISLSFTKSDSFLLEVLHQCNIPVKLNCVLTGKENYSELFEFVYKWQKQVNVISFRRDYKSVETEEDLRGEDSTLLTLQDIFGDYTSGGCEVCNDDIFKGGKVHYHRGKEKTLIEKKSHLIVNDIIIKQDGSLYLDWDKQHPVTPVDLLTQWDTKANTLPVKNRERVKYTLYGSCGGGGCGLGYTGGSCGRSCGSC